VRKGNSRSSGLIRNIDVSALAAILFVLLFMFLMLTATPHHGVSADLAKVGHPISIPGARREDALIVSILRDGSRYFARTSPGPATCLHKFEKVWPVAQRRKSTSEPTRASDTLRFWKCWMQFVPREWKGSHFWLNSAGPYYLAHTRPPRQARAGLTVEKNCHLAPQIVVAG
jgi:biopolymer transport protein ExbD